MFQLARMRGLGRHGRTLLYCLGHQEAALLSCGENCSAWQVLPSTSNPSLVLYCTLLHRRRSVTGNRVCSSAAGGQR